MKELFERLFRNNFTGVTFIILRPSGEMLLQLRDENSHRYKHMWCFPGGGLEFGETKLAAVVREVQEEFELSVQPENCIKLVHYDLSYGQSSYVFMCLIDAEQKPILHEGADMKWAKFSEIKNMQLGFEQEKILPEVEKFLKNHHVEE